MNLKGKKILITGASRGIGKAIALMAAIEGAELCLHYHSTIKEIEDVVSEIENKGGKCTIIPGDFNNPQEAIAVGNKAWELLKGVDYLINNAGVSYKTHFFDASLEDIDFFTNINFKSTLLLTQTITKKMVEKKIEGSVYTITSINGIQPGVGLSIYGATKGAIETLMKGVALELAPHNITINTIAAGAIRTDMTSATWKNKESLQQVNDNIPMGRIGETGEIAATILSLLTAGTYMTGATIVIDGGWSLKRGFVKPTSYTNNK